MRARAERCAVEYPDDPNPGRDHCWHRKAERARWVCCHCKKEQVYTPFSETYR